MRRDTRCKRNTTPRPLRTELFRDGLCAEEGAGKVDIVRPPPFIRRHLNRVRAAYDAGETAEHVYAAQYLYGAFYGRGNGFLVAYVDGFGYDARVRELGVQFLDAFEGLVGVHVPEGEARGAVFEEGGCGFEGEGAGAASDCGGGG